MKNVYLFVFLIFLSCESNKSSSQDETHPNSPSKTVKKIHFVENGFDSNIPYIYEGNISFSYLPSSTNISNIKYDIKLTQNGVVSNSDLIYNFSYSNNKLDNVTFGNSSMKFNYSNSILTSIDYYNIKGWSGKNAKFELNYNSDNRLEKIKCIHPYYTTENNLLYANNKLSKVTIIKDNQIYQNINLSYDDKFNSFKNISKELKIFFSLIDGYGYMFPYDEYNWLTSFWDENNVINYNENTFEYSYEDNYVKNAKVSFKYNSTQNNTTIFEYTY